MSSKSDNSVVVGDTEEVVVMPEPSKSYVVHGALTVCSCGSRPGILIVPISHGVYLKNKAQLNNRDGVGITNITSMGVCSAGKAALFPDKAERKKKGFLKTVSDFFFGSKSDEELDALAAEAITECAPSTCGIWANAKEDTYIGKSYYRALLSTSTISCLKGGSISIYDDGQEIMDHMAAIAEATAPPEEVPPEITEEGGGLWDTVKNLGTMAMGFAKDAVDGVVDIGNNIKNTLIETGNSISNILDSAKENVSNKLQSIVTGEPVDSVRGLLTEEFTDFYLYGVGYDLEIKRHYNSKNKVISDVGLGWSLGISSTVELKGSVVTVKLPDDSFEYFTKNEFGIWSNIRGGTEQYKLNEDYKTGIFSLTLPDKKCYKYNKQGNLSTIKDINGNTTVFSYIFETSKLEKIVNTSGLTLHFEYKDNKIAKIMDNIGRTVEYVYNGDFLVQTKSVIGGITSFTYDGQGYLNSIKDAKGFIYLENKFDSLGRVIWQKFDTKEVFVEYDDRLKKNTFDFVSENRKEIYYYNEDLLVTRFEHSDGSFEEYGYDQWGNKNSIRDKNGNIIKMEYDVFSNLLNKEYPNGNKEVFIYDDNNNLIKEVKSNGQIILRTYDSFGNLISKSEEVDNNDFATTNYEYDSKGRIIGEINAINLKIEIQYNNDFVKKPTSVKLPDNTLILFEYDSIGRRISQQIDKAKFEYSYSSGDKVTKIIDPLGNTTEMHYNLMNKLSQKIMPNEVNKGERAKRYYYDYNSFEFLNKIVDPLGNVVKKHVDENGVVLKEVHPNTYDISSDDGKGVVYDYDIHNNNTKIIYPDGSILRKVYDFNGNKVKEISQSNYLKDSDDGKSTVYKYDELNRLVEEVDTFGTIKHSFKYNRMGKISAITNANGDTSYYYYNKAGWLISKYIPKKIDVNNEVLFNLIMYEYNKLGQVITENRSGEYVKLGDKANSYNSIKYDYNKVGQVCRITDSTGAKLYIEYDQYRNKVMERKLINNDITAITRWNYDLCNRLIEKKEYLDGEPSTTLYSYDKNGNLTTLVTPMGYKIIREYNLVDKLTKETIIEKGVIKTKFFEYDNAYNLIKTVDVNGNVSSIEYDLNNRAILNVDRLGNKTRYMYTPTGKIQKIIKPKEYSKLGDNGVGTTFIYDSNDRLIQRINALNIKEVEYKYNLDGTIASETDAVLVTKGYDYDIGGRIVKINKNNKFDENNFINITLEQRDYDSLDNLISFIDGKGNETKYDLDKWGRINKILKANNSFELYEYDKVGNVTKTVDGNSNAISYIYGKNNKLEKIIDQDGLVEFFKYDQAGNLESHIDRIENEVVFQYGLTGEVLSKKSKNDNIYNLFEYNLDGTLSKAITDGICYTYSYDNEGKQLSKSNNGTKLFDYKYDENGNLLESVDLSGKKTVYVYDNLDRIDSVLDNGKVIARYEYNNDNTIKKLILGKGLINEYIYDINKKISKLKTYTENGKVIADNNYIYDKNGNQIKKIENGLKTIYRYDTINQIEKVIYGDGKEEKFTYDSVGNRLERIVKRNDKLSIENYLYDNKNRLQQVETDEYVTKYLYDNQGNVLEELHYTVNKDTIRKTIFSYDGFNRNIKVVKDDNMQENVYDPLNLRTSVNENGKIKNYVFKGRDIAIKLNQSNEILNREVRGYNLLSKIVENNESEFYYLHNEHNDITGIIDNDCCIKNTYDYDVFGRIVNTEENIDNEFTYYEQQFDKITQLYYLRARYYNAEHGRFIQEDVYRDDGLNLYAYVKNNPVMWIDPSGYAGNLAKNKDTGFFSKGQEGYESSVLGDNISLGFFGYKSKFSTTTMYFFTAESSSLTYKESLQGGDKGKKSFNAGGGVSVIDIEQEQSIHISDNISINGSYGGELWNADLSGTAHCNLEDGLYLSADAIASAVQGDASRSISIFGVEIGVGAEVYAGGIGATGHLSVMGVNPETAKRELFSAKAGAAAGYGGALSFYIALN